LRGVHVLVLGISHWSLASSHSTCRHCRNRAAEWKENPSAMDCSGIEPLNDQ
jgi:hypothetical protein